jgi:hypothetical protein
MNSVIQHLRYALRATGSESERAVGLRIQHQACRNQASR